MDGQSTKQQKMTSGASRAKIHGTNTGREFPAVETDRLHEGKIKIISGR